MTILLITNQPTAYRVDFFNLLAEHYGDRLTFCFVHEAALAHKDSISVFRGEPFLRRSLFYRHRLRLHRFFSLYRDVWRTRPSVIVNGGLSPRFMPLALYTKWSGAKLIDWWGGTPESEQHIPSLKRLYRRLAKRATDGGVFTSVLAQQYFQGLGGDPVPAVIIGNNTRDSRAYAARVDQYKPEDAGRGTVFVTVGFQQASKNTMALLDVFDQLAADAPDVELWVVGDGPALPALRSRAATLSCKSVRFLGYVPPDELFEVYAAADVFIHPSLYDRWPQTYNEAAAAGLAALVSHQSGIADEYTRARAGLATFDGEDLDEILEAMRRTALDRELRRELGSLARRAAVENDCHAAAKSFVSYVDALAGAPKS